MSKRLRDPVHGLIVFAVENDPVDRLAWRLLDTPELQRLRRIRQLGVSEFTFPGAVHTRFAHSIGVFHMARTLVRVIAREMARNGETQDDRKAEVALIAALLHDLGHGPFSHSFEHVQDAAVRGSAMSSGRPRSSATRPGASAPCSRRFARASPTTSRRFWRRKTPRTSTTPLSPAPSMPTGWTICRGTS
ncbi:HD domain-containing protein [Elioraea thermophila]|uniref:HD domain-containing protein n=1 Tax=Elioraea thermophila TaxID=2185104 RepID=UPI000DF36F21|nr:HD domain-containing protein [Elioraea thermophila]